jgi:hypothetical protein
MATNDFLTFAGDPAANVQPQAQFADPGYIPRILGFSSGTAISTELNKVWRQASLIAHVIGQFTIDATSLDMLDDATPAGLSALQTHFTTAIRNTALGVIGVGYLPLTGGSLSGPLNVTNSVGIYAAANNHATLQLGRAAGFYGLIQAYTGPNPRWQIQFPSAELEQGNDSGSNLNIVSFKDGGQYLDTPMSINRATGVVNFSHSPTVNGSNLPYVRMSGDVMNGPLGVGGTGISYNGLGGIWAGHRIAFGWDGALVNIAVDGTGVGAIATTAYVGSVANGYVLKSGDVMTGQLTVRAGIRVDGGLSCGSTVTFGGLGDFYNAYDGRYRYRVWAGNWYDVWDGNNGNRTWYANGQWMTLDGSGHLANSGAYRAYGGRIISIQGAIAPSVCAYWTGGVAVGFWADGSGMWFGNMDGSGNPFANSNHMLIDNSGYLTLWGSAHFTGSLWCDGNSSCGTDSSIGRNLYVNLDLSVSRNIWAGGALTGAYIHSTGSLDVDGGMGAQDLTVRNYLGVGGNLQVNNNINSNTITTNHVQSYGDIVSNGQVWCHGGALVSQNGNVYAHNGQNGPLMADVGIQYRPLGPYQIAFRWDGQKFRAWIDGGEIHLIHGEQSGNDRVNKMGMQADYRGDSVYVHDNDDSIWYLNTFRSDARLKKNIHIAPEFDSLAAIVATPIRSFEWLGHDKGIPHGFVSSDLRETLPDVVRPMPSGQEELGDIDHIDILPMLAHCFRAIRQLHEEIAALKEAKHV